MTKQADHFPLAPMCRTIRVVTYIFLPMPVLLVIGAFWNRVLLMPAVLVLAIYGWIWLGFRPTHFTVTQDAIEITWPFKQRSIPRSSITEVMLMTPEQLKNKVGWGVRVGAGGLWGGFGWLWTQKRGIVQMYVSRIDEFVWVECHPGRAWLITPLHPDAFIKTFKLKS